MTILTPITPELRAEITAYLAYSRLMLASMRHVSGNECGHCGLRQEIAHLADALEVGFIETYDYQDGE